jgi:predicted DNA-binding transcriptional regulator AlpA
MSTLLWDAAEVGRQLGFTAKTIQNWHALGEGPPAIKLGSRLRWRPADVARWVDDHPSAAPPTYELRRR